MRTQRRAGLPLATSLAALLAAPAPAYAFDDNDFCVAVKQLAIAAEKDVGVWVDRKTRNAGMVVSCDKKRVEFVRFTYASSASMDGAWKQSKAAEWNAAHCTSRLWTEAVVNGWQIALSVNTADGGRISLNAQCK